MLTISPSTLQQKERDSVWEIVATGLTTRSLMPSPSFCRRRDVSILPALRDRYLRLVNKMSPVLVLAEVMLLSNALL